jgi:hypothetical protein
MYFLVAVYYLVSSCCDDSFKAADHGLAVVSFLYCTGARSLSLDYKILAFRQVYNPFDLCVMG